MLALQLCETVSFLAFRSDAGRTRSSRTAGVEEAILEMWKFRQLQGHDM